MSVPIEQDSAATLAKDVASGDEIAFAHLVAAYHRDLIRVAFVVCGDADLAEDAVQSAWTIAWRKVGSVRDPDRVRAWLIAVAANEARQLLRRRGRRQVREIHVAADPVEIADPTTGPDRGDVIDLAAVLARLGPDDRRLIAMRYAAGLTSVEMAASLGMSPGSVRVRLGRILGRLRKELGDA